MANQWENISPKKIPSSTKIDGKFWSYLKKGDNVLEVGCGNGRFVLSCAVRGFNATGIDINKKAVELAQEEAWAFGANVFCADILTVNFKEKFKGVLLQGVLCSMEKDDRIKCLKKIKSIMEPGGFLHIAEFEMSDKYADRYREDYKLTGEYGTLSIKDKETGQELCRSHNFYKEEIVELLEKAGFELVSFKRTFFTSYHGEEKPGIMIIVRN